MSLVSIIIPVWNVEKYIDRCLESVLAQTYSDIEILLMVGKCTDNSLQKCIEWQKKDDRIIIVSRKDKGLGDARNYAMQIASGEFISYIDSDDFVESTYIEKLVTPLIEDDTVDMTYCGYDKYDGNKYYSKYIPRLNGKQDMNFEKFLEYIDHYAVWLKLFRKQFISSNDIKMPEGMVEDVTVYYESAVCVQKVFFVNEVLYHYNVENENRLTNYLQINTGCKHEIKALEQVVFYMKNRKVFDKYYYIMVNKVQHSLFQQIFRCGNEELYEIGNMFIKKYFPDLTEKYNRIIDIYCARDKVIKNNIVFFGAGEKLMKLLAVSSNNNVKYIVDNNASLYGKRINELPVYSPEHINKDGDSPTVVISSTAYASEIYQQLWNMGVRNVVLYYEYMNYINQK